MSDRKRDVVWLSFEEVKKKSRRGVRAKCKYGGIEFEGQVLRMKNHLSKCESSVIKVKMMQIALQLPQAQLIHPPILHHFVEHPQFVKFMQQLRPDTIYEDKKKTCSLTLENEKVCLGFDGWSNVHNEPIICATVTTKEDNAYLVTQLTHLVMLTLPIIWQKWLARFVLLLPIMLPMCKLLENNEDLNIIIYGSSAHILNLLANDFNIQNVTEHMLSLIIYFKNNHFANACYRQSGAQKLILPIEVCWNTMVDCLERYLKGWGTLLQICEDISVVAWKNFEMKMEATKYKNVIQKFQKNIYDMALIPAPFLAYMLDPKEKKSSLDLTEEENAWHLILLNQLLTAEASSASLERVFSLFGLVHSKRCYKLGTEKASQLVFQFKAFTSGRARGNRRLSHRR
ncbi:hypothetical protein PR048_005518 [Dryococelus australis]|uniref:HAT C-terminal dimerisation domain-containing protein n=1 Tax=Dryococelus australis TaxID=614101 RepID=A0ABQ9I8C8_9NEOP|nr:hypothetical protein PR048_005518 [Dryococelus australis]